MDGKKHTHRSYNLTPPVGIFSKKQQINSLMQMKVAYSNKSYNFVQFYLAIGNLCMTKLQFHEYLSYHNMAL